MFIGIYLSKDTGDVYKSLFPILNCKFCFLRTTEKKLIKNEPLSEKNEINGFVLLIRMYVNDFADYSVRLSSLWHKKLISNISSRNITLKQHSMPMNPLLILLLNTCLVAEIFLESWRFVVVRSILPVFTQQVFSKFRLLTFYDLFCLSLS